MLTVILSLFGIYICSVDYSNTSNGGFKNVMYYGDWSVWGGQDNFYPAAMPIDQLTHLNFAFLDFDADGELILADVDAAYKHPLGIEGVTWGDANAGVLPALQDLRSKYPNLRLGVSLGGWSLSGDFATVAKNSVSRANLVNQVGRFVEYNNLDFIDVDWEYPGSVRQGDTVDSKNDEGTPNAAPDDGKAYIQLLRDLKAKENELAKKNNRVYELSVAMPGTSGILEAAAQAYLPAGVNRSTATPAQIQAASTEYLTTLFDVIDFGNLMTYDLTGAWSFATGHHSALYSHHTGIDELDAIDFSADALVSYLLGKSTDSRGNALRATLQKGVPPEKIVVGAAFYTRGWEKTTNNGPAASRYPGLFGTVAAVNKDADGSATAGANNAVTAAIGDGGRLGGVWPYGKLSLLLEAYPGLTYYYDDIADAPYLYNEATGAFFTYDSPRSVAAKAEYVRQNKLGGIISWMASDDAATGDEQSGEYTSDPVRDVLTKAIKVGLYGSTPLEQFNIGAPALQVSAAVSVGTSADTGKQVYQIDVTNDFVNSETNAALDLAAKAANAIAFPKLYITLKNGITVGSGSAYGSGTWTQEGNLVTDDLSTSYFLRTLDAGEAANVVLPATTETGADLDASDIVKIEISKQVYPNGKEVGRLVIYGGK